MCAGNDQSAALLKEQERQRAGLITRGLESINKTFSGFGPEYYGRLRGSYLAAALPQVQEQYDQTRRQLGYNLADQRLLNSSAASQLGGSLQRQLGTQRQNVANQAVQATQDLQRQIQGNRTQLVSQLEASADPTAAAQGALAASTQFQAPNLLQPLGSLFQNWSNVYLARQYSNQAVQQRQAQANQLPVNLPKTSYDVR